MTIAGTNFTGATDVYFGSADVPLTPSMVNAGGTAITVTSPAGTGTVDVTVTDSPYGTSTTSSADQFTYLPPLPPTPVVTGSSQSSGPVAGDTLVTITGSGLENATFVSFGTSGHDPQRYALSKSSS